LKKKKKKKPHQNKKPTQHNKKKKNTTPTPKRYEVWSNPGKKGTTYHDDQD